MRTKASGESTLLLLDAASEPPDLDLLRKLAARYGTATARSLESLLSGLS